MLRVDQLSARQRQILDSVAAGKSNGVIADEIGITLDGVKWHVSELLGETGFASRHELADWWRQRETSPRAAPVWLPRRALSHPLAAGLARVVAVFAIAAAIAAGISVVAQRGADVTLAPTPAAQDKIAYVQGGDLWVKTLPDGQPRRITTDGQAGTPRWSSSGGWLAYDDASATWIARTDGSAARRVDGFSGWSPVADRYAGVDPSGAIFVENADGTRRKTLAQWHGSPAEDGGFSNLVW
ncbi:MAG TPA: LuxR C-terminal-related transcriptional regulator, partial [Steroidobacteraceae bacterium]|nr:LuxR C-terminal-related transcriptional regulator [Steroidobacteraceae bacterium]